jgi:hypothetical protein
VRSPGSIQHPVAKAVCESLAVNSLDMGDGFTGLGDGFGELLMGLNARMQQHRTADKSSRRVRRAVLLGGRRFVQVRAWSARASAA